MRRFLLFVVAFVQLLGLSGTAPAEPPSDTAFQGLLLDSDEQPLSGPVTLQLRIYEALSPTAEETALFVEDHRGVALERGVFSIRLGQGERWRETSTRIFSRA